MKRLIVLFCLIIIVFLFAPEAARAQVPTRIDSLQAQLKGSKSDTSRIRLWLGLSEAYQHRYRQVNRPPYQPEQEHLFLLDSALVYAKRAAAFSRQHSQTVILTQSLLAIGRTLSFRRETALAIPFVQEALELSTARKDTNHTAQALHLLGKLRELSRPRTEANNKEAIAYYEQCIALYKQLGDTLKRADVMGDLADIYLRFYDPKKARQILLEQVAMLKPLGEQYWVRALSELSFVCSNLGEYKEALQYQLQSLRYYESKGDSIKIYYTYYDLAYTYRYLKDFSRSIAYFRKCIRYYMQDGDTVPAIRLMHNVLSMYLEQGNLPQARQYASQIINMSPKTFDSTATTIPYFLAFSYQVLGEYKKAEYWYLTVLPRYERPPVNIGGLISLYLDIGDFYRETKQYEKARLYLKKALAVNMKKADVEDEIAIHQKLFQVDSTLGNLHSALFHYQQATLIKDSLFNATKNKQLGELQVQYDTEKKEQDIRLKEQSIKALNREKQLQAKQIEQDKLIRNVIISGALMLLLLVAVLYNRYRLKQQSNQLLQAQQAQLQRQHQELQSQQSKLQAQHQELQSQQEVINHKNEQLEQVVADKDHLLTEQQRLLADKERLLKEIHHRVKNNLQIVMSLLNSQAASLQDKAALSAIQESQHRVQAMALIHQKLYQSEGIARIPMKAYIEEVVNYLHDSYELSSPVRFALQIEEIELDVTQAVPLGLIINEALTNAFKYAFPGGRPGTISLRLVRLAEHTYELSIADDGIGLPHDFDPSRSRSLGMTLLHGFSGQLGGELSLTSQDGLSISLVFGEEPFSSSVEPVSQADLMLNQSSYSQ